MSPGELIGSLAVSMRNLNNTASGSVYSGVPLVHLVLVIDLKNQIHPLYWACTPLPHRNCHLKIDNHHLVEVRGYDDEGK